IVKPLQKGNLRIVGQFGFARPYPDETVTLDYRKDAGTRKTTNALHGHGSHFAFAVHRQAVVAAHQIVAVDIAQRQGRATVRAEIFESADLTVSPTIKHHTLAAYLATQGFFLDFVRGTGYVPSI